MKGPTSSMESARLTDLQTFGRTLRLSKPGRSLWMAPALQE